MRAPGADARRLQTRAPIATTPNAHADFVKVLLVLPGLRLLVSGGSDKIVRFWCAPLPPRSRRG
jgi:hypothetical protein